ncbi:MAG: Smr/MutS family protein [Gammaproteobacteria bacterium]|nr:Smr/MutS family protein [Gammaproteobacteria bacterium]
MSKKKPDNDDDLFRQMMSDVKPLSHKKSAERCIPSNNKTRPSPQQRTNNRQSGTTTDFIPRDYVPDVAPEESLFFSRGGLQHRLLRQFRHGDLRPEAQLDLHGCTLMEAAALLARFLSNAQNNHQRCVHVIHGKGHRSSEGRPVLKAQVNQWLRDVPFVLAFSSAQAKDGGMGAVYVLLRRQP